MEQGLQDESDFVATNLDGIAEMEAKLAFLTDEKNELTGEREIER